MELARPTLSGHWGNATLALAVIAVALALALAMWLGFEPQDLVDSFQSFCGLINRCSGYFKPQQQQQPSGVLGGGLTRRVPSSSRTVDD
jgi:hypothetical protein